MKKKLLPMLHQSEILLGCYAPEPVLYVTCVSDTYISMIRVFCKNETTLLES